MQMLQKFIKIKSNSEQAQITKNDEKQKNKVFQKTS